MSANVKTACPDQEILAAFVSGQLPESDVESVSAHLDQCEKCQRLTDEIGGLADSLVAALRHPASGDSPTENLELGKWMLKAKRRDLKPTDELAASADASVSLDQFIQCLSKSRLLSGDDVLDFSQSSDAASLAQELVERETLTPFQARALLRGRWKGLVLGHYEVLHRIGHGGMGQVFRGRHRQMGQDVCLKVLHAAGRRSPKHLERFRREAQTIAALNHPNIVVAHDASEDGGLQYIAMEYVKGSDLAKYVKRRGPLSPGAAGTIILQTARALSHAHQQGVIHRDVKPHNLMLDTSGNVKILDMGLARFQAEADSDDDQSQMTKTGAVLGTVDYMAPEQAMNARNADARCDVYSLGCTLYFLLTGNSMYGGQTVVERLIAHRELPVPSLRATHPKIPVGLDAIFQRAVAKNPDDRFQTMGEMATSLEGFLAGVITGNERVEPPIVEEEPVQLEAIQFIEPGTAPSSASAGSALPATISYDPLSGTMTDLGIDSPTVASLGSLAPSGALTNWQDNNGLPAAPPLKPKTKKSRQPIAPALMWGGVAAGGLALLLVAALALSALLGSSGQALVVVSPDGFSEADYYAVTKALDKRGISHVTGSTQAGHAKSSWGNKIPVDVKLDETHAGKYDAVIVCGGNSHCIKGNPILRKSLDKGAVVAGVGDGWNAMHGVWDGKKKWDDVKSGCEIQNTKGGRLVKVCNAESAESALDHVFTKLVKK